MMILFYFDNVHKLRKYLNKGNNVYWQIAENKNEKRKTENEKNEKNADYIKWNLCQLLNTRRQSLRVVKVRQTWKSDLC